MDACVYPKSKRDRKDTNNLSRRLAMNGRIHPRNGWAFISTVNHHPDAVTRPREQFVEEHGGGDPAVASGRLQLQQVKTKLSLTELAILWWSKQTTGAQLRLQIGDS